MLNLFLVTLPSVIASSLQVLPVKMRVWREIEATLHFIFSFLTFLGSSAVNIGYTLLSLTQTVFFSPLGALLLGSALLGSLGYIMVEHQPRILSSIDWAMCFAQPFFSLIYKFLDNFNVLADLILCFWDLFNGAGQIFIRNAFNNSFNCFDTTTWTKLLETIGVFAVSILNALFNWVAGSPLTDTITIISSDPTDQTPWLLWTQLNGYIIAQGDCQCSGLHDYIVFVVNVFDSQNLGYAIHHLLNVPVIAFQTVFRTVIEGGTPAIDPLTGRIQLGVNSLGDWIDEVITTFIQIFKTSAAPNLALGCVASRLVSVLVEGGALVGNAGIKGIDSFISSGTVNFFDIIATANIPNLVGRTHDVAICTEELVANIDSCGGQVAGATVDLVSVTIEFAGRFVQQGQINIPLLSNAIFRIFGDLTYDITGNPSHVISCTSPPCRHVRPCLIPGTCGTILVTNLPGTSNTTLQRGAQSGLVCLASHLLSDTKIARAFADLLGATGQFFLVPLFIVDDLISIDYSALLLSGNPLDNDSLSNTVDIFFTVLCTITDRFVNELDYFGHFMGSIPGLDALGDGIVTLAAIMDEQIDNIKTLIIYLLLTILEGIIWFFSLVGASPFEGRTAGDETSTFFTIFFKFILQTGGILLNLLEGLINYEIFPGFSKLFGQNSLKDTDPGTITLTGCFGDIKDCLCGLTKEQIGNRVCLGSLGCLSSWWPDCGDFNPEGSTRRRRSSATGTVVFLPYNVSDDGVEYDMDGNFIYDSNIYDFFAEHYGNNEQCGDLFMRWAVLQPHSTAEVSESEALSYIKCVSSVINSAKATTYMFNNTNNTDIPSDFFMNSEAISRTAIQLSNGTEVAISVAVNNILLSLSDPAIVSDQPELDVVYYDLEEELRRRGVNDTIAVGTVTRTYNATKSLAQLVKKTLEDTIQDQSENSGFLKASSGVLWGATYTAGYGISTASSMIMSARRHGLVTKLNQGFWRGLGHWWYTLLPEGVSLENQHFLRKIQVELPSESETESDSLSTRMEAESRIGQRYTEARSNRRRSVSAHQIAIDSYYKAASDASSISLQSFPLDPMKDPLYRVQHNMLPRDITEWDMVSYKASILSGAASEYFIRLTGQGQPIRPLMGPEGEPLQLETTIPDSCISVRSNCSVDFSTCLNPGGHGCFVNSTVTCTGPTFYIPPFRVCNNFFGMAIVAGYCSRLTGQTLDFYYSVQQCKDLALGGPLDPPTTYPNTSFTYPVQIVVAGDIPNTCLNTLHPQLGNICLSTNGCTTCPTEELFPGFSCKIVDDSVSDIEFLARLCINKAPFGPKLPQLPTNITAWEYNALNPHVVDVMQFGTCGNKRVETNVTYSYKNTQTQQTFNFTGEQCDPPYSTGFVVNNGTNVSYLCGPSCQYAFCGNGIIDPGEECDDGFGNNGLRCSGKCRLKRCGNGIIDEAEECDDGNPFSNDGCSSLCVIEICPQYMFASSIMSSPASYNLCPPTIGSIRSTTPMTCHNMPGNQMSMSISCTPLIPVVEVYYGPGCYTPPNVYAIEDTCANTDAICINNLIQPDPNNCNAAVQVGLDFTCAKNCSFCGDGIVNNNEQCDDGTIFPTGDPIEDQCVFCHNTCECHPDFKVPCVGFCAGGSSSGEDCNPREAGQCGGAPCLAYSCCGDGILQGNEMCDDNPNPLLPNASTPCLACVVSTCNCQPGKPCLGVCHLNSVEISIGPTGNSVPLYCDMTQEPFACNSFNRYTNAEDTQMNCIPVSCCGDGITQFIETDPDLGFSESPSGNCSYIDPSTGLQKHPQNPRFELYGRRDLCGHLPFGLNRGVCYQSPFILATTCSAGPDLILPIVNCPVLGHFSSVPVNGQNLGCCCGPPPVLNITHRIGQCYYPNGFPTTPKLLCNREEDNSCVNMNITGGICGAIACCDDYEYYPTTASQLSEAILEDEVYGCEETISFCDGDGKCEYGKFMPSFDRCECQPDSACLGRCTYASVATDVICDPVDNTNSPWCPTIAAGGIDPLYECVPVACCNDGIKKETQGEDIASIGISGFPFYNGQKDTLLNLEVCDPAIESNPDCQKANVQNSSLSYPTTVTFDKPWSDCGLYINNYPHLYTRSTIRPGFICVGHCTDLSTGIATDEICGSVILTTCPSGLSCWFTACCGNGKLEYPETSECTNSSSFDCGGSTDCGLHDLLFARKRKRQMDLVILDDTQLWSATSTLHLENITTIVTNIEQFNFTSIEDPLSNFTVSGLEFIFNLFGFSTNSSATVVQKVIDWATRPGYGQGTPVEERGLIYSLDLHRSCKQPWNTDPTISGEGVGFQQAFRDFFFWISLILLVTGLAGIFLGNQPLVWALMLLVLIGGIAFGQYAWNASLRCWITGIVPVTLWTELKGVVGLLLDGCAHWLDDFLVDLPSNNTCPDQCGSREFITCKIYFPNGYAWLRFLLDRWVSTSLASILASSPIAWLLGLILPGFSAGFSFVPPAPPDSIPGQDVNCFFWSFGLLGQVIFVFSTMTTFILFPFVLLLQIVTSFLVLWRSAAHAVEVYEEEAEASRSERRKTNATYVMALQESK